MPLPLTRFARAWWRLVLPLALISGAYASSPTVTAPASLQVADLAGTRHPVLTGDARDLVVLYFMATECPVSNRTLPALHRLAAEFASESRIRFLGVYADPGRSSGELRDHARAFQVALPLRSDPGLTLARRLGVTRTPEAVVIDGAGALLYRGRIDDRFVSFGVERPRATQEDLRDVLSQVATGARPAFRTQPGFGCTLNAALCSP